MTSEQAVERVRVVRLRRFPEWLVHMLRTHGIGGLSCRLASSGWTPAGFATRDDEPPIDVVPIDASVVGLDDVGEPTTVVRTFKVWCVNRVAALLAAFGRSVVRGDGDEQRVVLLIESFVDERGEAADERRLDVDDGYDDDARSSTATLVCEPCDPTEVEALELVLSFGRLGGREASPVVDAAVPTPLSSPIRATAADVGVNTECEEEFGPASGADSERRRTDPVVAEHERRASSASRVRFAPSSTRSLASPDDADAADGGAWRGSGAADGEQVPCTLLVDVNGATMCSLQGVLTLDCLRALAAQRVVWPATNGASQVPLMLLRENGGGALILVDTMYTVEEQLEATAHGTRRYLVSMYKNRRASSSSPRPLDGPLRRERQRAYARR